MITAYNVEQPLKRGNRVRREPQPSYQYLLRPKHCSHIGNFVDLVVSSA